MLLEPKGIITAGISDKEGYFIGEVDLEYTRKCREANPELKNRRPELYKNWILPQKEKPKTKTIKKYKKRIHTRLEYDIITRRL